MEKLIKDLLQGVKLKVKGSNALIHANVLMDEHFVIERYKMVDLGRSSYLLFPCQIAHFVLGALIATKNVI